MVIHRLLVLDIGQTGIRSQVGEHAVYAFTTAGDGAVDALLCQQQGAAGARLPAGIQQGLPQLVEVVQGNKFVQRCNNDVRHTDLLALRGIAAAMTRG